MIRSILVPLDGSNFGEQALPYALSVARRTKARVELLHVHVPLTEAYTEVQFYNLPLGEKVKEEERQYVSNLVKNLTTKAQGVSVSAVFQEGPVARTIQDYVDTHAFDLVVLTTHARGAFGRFWLGSVADYLVRHLTAPILLVRPGEKLLPVDLDVKFQHVLVPLDGTSLAEEILEPARGLAGLYGADFTLLRVVQHVVPTTVPLGTPGSFGQLASYAAEEIKEVQGRLSQEAHNYLAGVAGRLRSEGLRVQTEVAVEDQPAQAILHQTPTDLIAMATHGRRGLARVFRGSVADKVLRGSTVPLLVQRPKKTG